MSAAGTPRSAIPACSCWADVVICKLDNETYSVGERKKRWLTAIRRRHVCCNGHRNRKQRDETQKETRVRNAKSAWEDTPSHTINSLFVQGGLAPRAIRGVPPSPRLLAGPFLPWGPQARFVRGHPSLPGVRWVRCSQAGRGIQPSPSVRVVPVLQAVRAGQAFLVVRGSAAVLAHWCC